MNRRHLRRQHCFQLVAWLYPPNDREGEAANATRGSRDRVTLLRIYEDLRGLGYEAGYDAVRRYAAAWRREGSTGTTAAVFVPLSFDPGEAYHL